jgi:hypothetical protein
MRSLEFVRYLPKYLEPVLELHRDAQVGLGPIGVSQRDEETDLREIEEVYFKDGGEFLIGILHGEVIAMGGYQRLSKNQQN